MIGSLTLTDLSKPSWTLRVSCTGVMKLMVCSGMKSFTEICKPAIRICWSPWVGITLLTLTSSIRLGKLTEFSFYIVFKLFLKNYKPTLVFRKFFSFPYHPKISFSLLCYCFQKPTRRDTFIWIKKFLWTQIKTFITTTKPLWAITQKDINNKKGIGIVFKSGFLYMTVNGLDLIRKN